MSTSNNCSFIGRLGDDPIKRFTQTGTPVTNIRIAVNEVLGRDAAGNPIKTTTWIPVVLWRGLAENTAQYCKKGHNVGVSGRMQNREYTDRDGIKRTVTELVAADIRFLESKPKTEAGPSYQAEVPPPVEEEVPPPAHNEDSSFADFDTPF